MTDIVRTFNMQVKDGPRFGFNNTIAVEAYDKIDVEVPGDGKWLNVQVQPAALGDIEVLLISRTDKPAEGMKNLLYKVNEDKTEVELTNLHLAMGSGVFGLLKASPNVIKFRNQDEAPAHVTILVARRATPEPEATPPAETPKVEPKTMAEAGKDAQPVTQAPST